MDFVTKSFRKDETLTSWTLLRHICPHFWAWLLNIIVITPKSEDKNVVKVFSWSEFHLSEMTLLQNWHFNIILLAFLAEVGEVEGCRRQVCSTQRRLPSGHPSLSGGYNTLNIVLFWGKKSFIFSYNTIRSPPKIFLLYEKSKKRQKNRFDIYKYCTIEAEGWEFAKLLRSLEQFIQTVKGQNNFW